MRLAPLALCLALAACASPPPDPARVRAALARAPNIDVCRAMYYGPDWINGKAYEEKARRGIDCENYAAAIQAQDAAQRAASNAAISSLIAPGGIFNPTPPPSPVIQPTINCQSYRYGNQVQTTCR
jgi:hypothetical protein